MTQRKKYRRSRKLIQPSLQLRLTFTFVGISALSLLLQFVLFADAINELALQLPQDGSILLGRSAELLTRVLWTSCLGFLPITFLVGILTTFRIAGPVYRFKAFLAQVERGECPPDLRLRKGDELHDLAAQINSATAPLRRQRAAEGPSPSDVDVNEVPSLVGEAEKPVSVEQEVA